MSSPRGPIKWEKKLSASLFMLWIWNDHAAKWHLILITFKGIRSANFYNWSKNTILVNDLWMKGPESSRTIFENIRAMTLNLDRAHLRVFGQRIHNEFKRYDLWKLFWRSLKPNDRLKPPLILESDRYSDDGRS